MKIQTIKLATVAKIALALLLTGFVSMEVCAQNSGLKTTFDYDPAPFEGVWEGSEGNKSFLIRIHRDNPIFEPAGIPVEILVGAIDFFQNGEMIRTTIIDGFNSYLKGSLYAEYKCNFMIYDTMVKVGARVDFVIDENDTLTAYWTLSVTPGVKIILPGQEPRASIDDIGLPRTMTLRKVE